MKRKYVIADKARFTEFVVSTSVIGFAIGYLVYQVVRFIS